jgi:Ca2+-binding RTX toxin-like protein
MLNSDGSYTFNGITYTPTQMSEALGATLDAFGTALQGSIDPRLHAIGEGIEQISTGFKTGWTTGAPNIGSAAARILLDIAAGLAFNSVLAPLGAPAVNLLLLVGVSPQIAGVLAGALFSYFLIFGVSEYLVTPFVDEIINPLINWLRDPLALDLDGDGIELVSLANSTTYFDLDGNGFAERTGWVSSDDGILVRDGNRNGNVDSLAELFGSATQDGFAVLETFDDNHDGKIDAQDTVFTDLKVWRDLNQNGVSEVGELFTLGQLGIQSISVQTQDVTGTNEGHDLGVTGLFTRTDGTTGNATSIYFQTDGQDSVPDETGFTPAAGVNQLPQLPRSGNLHSIAYTATNDADFRADLTALVNTAGTLSAAELRSAFEALLLDWAGADAVPEGSRGAWVDAQHLAFVEAFFGNTFRAINIFGSVISTSPNNATVGAQIEGSFNQIVDVMLAVFLAQVPASQLAQGADFADVIANPYFFYSLLDFRGATNTTDPSPTPGNLGVVLDLITSIAPSAFGDATDYYAKALSGLAGLQTIAFGNDEAAFTAFMTAQLQDISNVTLRTIAISIATQDAMLGSATSDVLVSGDSNDVTIGGQGTDLMQSGDGSDIYVYKLGDGEDWIHDTGNNASDHDQLVLQDINAADVGFIRNGSTLILYLADGGSVTIVDFFKNWQTDNKGVDSIRFADGSIFDRTQILAASSYVGTQNSDSILDTAQADIIRGGEGHDSIQISGGSDTLVWSKGDGWDTVKDTVLEPAAVDRLVLADVLPTEVELTRAGLSLIIKVLATNETLTFLDFFDGYIPGVSATNKNLNIDQIEFSNGLVWDRETIQELAFIRGNEANNGLVDSSLSDIIIGGQGNDHIAVNFAGNDLIIWRSGDGDDTIDRNYYGNTDTKTLRLENIGVDDVRFSFQGATLLITILETNEVIRVENQLAGFTNFNTLPTTPYGLNFIEFENGVTLDRAAIARKTGLDFVGISFGTSDPSLSIVGQGVTISGTGGSGTTWYPEHNRDVTIHVILANAVTQTDEFGNQFRVLLDSSGSSHFTSGSFSGLSLWTFGQPQQPPNTSINPNYHSMGDPGFSQTHGLFESYVNAGGISSVVNQYEVLELLQVDASGSQPIIDLPYGIIVSHYDWINVGLRFGGTNNRDIFYGATEVFTNNAGQFVGNPTLDDVVNGYGGDDVILGLDGDDLLVGGDGHDIVEGGEGSDLLSGGAGSDFLSGGVGSDILHGGAGTDYLDGGDGNDMLSGGLGDDNLSGGRDSDYYVYESGGGNDTISDNGNASSGSDPAFDTLFLKDLNTSDVEFTNVNGNLIITVLETGEVVTIIGGFNSAIAAIEVIVFADGTHWTIGQVAQNLTLRGTAFRDGITGTSFDETIIGSQGDDYLDCSNGADTYLYRRGDGNDVIADGFLNNADHLDYLKFTDLNATDLYFTRVGANLIIQDRLTGQSITIVNQNLGFGSYTSIERIQFADGSTWTQQDISNNLSLLGTDFSESLYGSTSKEIIAGGRGDDSLYSNGGDDVFVYGVGDGHDTITGNSGDQTLQFLNLNASDLILTRKGYDVIVQFGSYGGSVTLLGQTNPYISSGIENIQFADGTTWSAADIRYWYSEGSAYYTGSAGGDTIVGSHFNQILEGAGGADFIDGKGGSDTLIGGDGDDTLAISTSGIADLDVLDGGLGTDTASFIEFGHAIDVDLVTAGGRVLTSWGTSIIVASTNRIGSLVAVENIIGSAFDDRLFGSTEANLIVSGDGNDLVDSRSGDDIIFGGNGNDTLRGGLGIDVLYGESGLDRLDGGLGSDTMVGGDGNDIYYANVEADTVVETNADLGIGGIDLIYFSGSSGTFILTANVERLTMTGMSSINGSGNELDNRIIGNIGVNVLSGFGGNDILDGGEGSDTMIGGEGDDIYYADVTTDIVIESNADLISGGNDLIYFSGVSGTLVLGDNIERLTLTGTSTINGMGNDLNNRIIGNDAANILFGGLGNDTLTGRGGSDIFYFDTLPNGISNRDVVTDFVHNQDDIGLLASIFNSIGTTLDVNEFKLGSLATDADDYLIYNSVNGWLYYDADGNGDGVKVAFARVAAGTVLDTSDFLIF